MTRAVEFWTGIGLSDPRLAPERASLLESDGWDGILVYDSQCLLPDVWSVLTMCATTTERVKLAPGVTNLITRHPSVTAAAAATLQIISDGRAVIGLGRGDTALSYVGASPLKAAAFEHYIEVLQTYLRGEQVDMNVASAMLVDAKAGFENLAVGSAPAGSSLKWLAAYDLPKVPIYAYATGPRAIALAARTAETVLFSLGADVDRVAWGVDVARTAAAEAGRAPVGVGAVLTVIPHDDITVARDLARGTVAATAKYSVTNGKIAGPVTDKQRMTLTRLAQTGDANVLDDEFVEQFAIVGSVDSCVDRLNELADLGLDSLNLGLSPEVGESYDLLVNAVLPRVREHRRQG